MLNLSEKDVDTEEGLGWRVWEQVLEEGVECTALAKTLPGWMYEIKANVTIQKELELFQHFGSSKVAVVVKNPEANMGDVEDAGSIPGSVRCPGGGYGNPLQYSCPENPMERGAWWATVYRAANTRTRLKLLSLHKAGCRCADPCCR